MPPNGQLSSPWPKVTEAENKHLRERRQIALQSFSLCIQCRAGLIAVVVEGEIKAVCSAARLEHHGHISKNKIKYAEIAQHLNSSGL